MKKIFLFMLLGCLTGCLYKMPTDDCISTLPNMNNPAFTREKPPSLLPGRG